MMKADQQSCLSQASLLCDMLRLHGECTFIFNGVLVKVRENPAKDFGYKWQMYQEDTNECYNPISFGNEFGTVFNVIDKMVFLICNGKHLDNQHKLHNAQACYCARHPEVTFCKNKGYCDTPDELWKHSAAPKGEQ